MTDKLGSMASQSNTQDKLAKVGAFADEHLSEFREEDEETDLCPASKARVK
jgi:hypothetical protein